MTVSIRAAASAKRSVAPQKGSSSALLNLTAIGLPEERTAPTRKATSVHLPWSPFIEGRVQPGPPPPGALRQNEPGR